jgi:S1-C subfamily serine protease
MKRTLPWLLFAGILLLTSLACSFGSSASRNQPVTTVPVLPIPTNSAPASAPAALPNAVSQDSVLTQIYDQINPGVVSILVTMDQGSAQGSGFVYDKNGYIITNNHVVDGATAIEVDFPSGLKLHAKTVGTDTDSDLAVIKVDAPADQLFPLTLGSAEALKVGQTVIAIGNPFGQNGTMTVGIVSAKDRTSESQHEAPNGGYFASAAEIQTDVAINPGNSGGPLLNLSGEVVGVVREIYSQSTNANSQPVNSGIGFAVSVDIVKRVVPTLIKTGHVDYPYLGISCLDSLTLSAQEALKLSQSTGAYVIDVRPSSPAAKAGLVAGADSNGQVAPGGDLIVAIDGQPVRVFGDLLNYLMVKKSPGDQVVLTVLRGGQNKEVTVTLAKRP